MSQAEVLQFLKEYAGTWFKRSEIQKKIPINERTIRKNLQELRKSGFVEMKTGKIETKDGWRHGLLYRYSENTLTKRNSGVVSCKNCGHTMLLMQKN